VTIRGTDRHGTDINRASMTHQATLALIISYCGQYMADNHKKNTVVKVYIS